MIVFAPPIAGADIDFCETVHIHPLGGRITTLRPSNEPKLYIGSGRQDRDHMVYLSPMCPNAMRIPFVRLADELGVTVRTNDRIIEPEQTPYWVVFRRDFRLEPERRQQCVNLTLFAHALLMLVVVQRANFGRALLRALNLPNPGNPFQRFQPINTEEF